MLKRRLRPGTLWLPILLIGLAFLLRIYRLDAQDIWGDEAMSIAISALPMRDTLLAETNPPAYFWLLRPLRLLWGSSPFAIRYLSVLGGTLAVVLIGQIGATVGGWRLRSWSLLVAALSPFLVYYGQEARMNATVVPAAAGCFWLFLRIVKRQNSATLEPVEGLVESAESPPIRDWLAYTLFTLIAIFSHYYAFAVLVVQGVAMLLLAVHGRKWHMLRSWLAVWGGMALLFVPFFILHRRAWGGQTALRAEEWRVGPLLEIGRRTLAAFGLGTTISAEQLPFTLILLAIALFGFISLRRSKQFESRFLLGAILGGILFAWLLTPLLPFFWERYLLPSTPPFVVLVAAGLYGAARWHRWAALLAGLIVIGLSLLSLNQYYFDSDYVRGSYGQAMALIDAERGEDDLILLNGPLQAALFDYYQPDNLDAVTIPRDQLLDEETVEQWFGPTVDSYRRVWLVESGNPLEYDPSGAARSWLAENGRFALHRDFVGVGLDLFVLGVPDEADVLTNVEFGGEIVLTGFAVDSAEIAPGDPVLLTLFWEAQKPIDNAYTVFTHVTDANGNVVAQADRQPVGGSRPTDSWEVGEPIVDSYAILVDGGISAETYQLQVGLYLWPDLTRLPILNTNPTTDKTTLTEITITQP